MSCLFDSLSYFIEEDSFAIRNKICNYLENNFIIMEDLETKSILDLENPNYVQNMRNCSTWGGAIEIQVACNIWKAKIIVHNKRDSNNNHKIEFIPVNNEINSIFELYWTGGHYEPVRLA